ncbi:unnamed protein product [Orchesella dallaii]|uniref:Uncharacterized protein n=1 Tax=Orchesella dallaii TaxID=48710 RepID=A0ABP1QUA4_9HEXA
MYSSVYILSVCGADTDTDITDVNAKIRLRRRQGLSTVTTEVQSWAKDKDLLHITVSVTRKVTEEFLTLEGNQLDSFRNKN